MSDVIKSIRDSVNNILKIRDDIGAALKTVTLITRTWSGDEIGDGTFTDVTVILSPSPRVVEFKHDLRLLEGGAVKQGDILLKMISKQTYPTDDLLDAKTSSKKIESLYEVGDSIYTPTAITEKHLTWNVLLRKKSSKRS